MLEYFKMILKKVSFDKRLFEKELRKAIATLVRNEIDDLRRWCYAQFAESYRPVLDKCFAHALS
jgi:hypothetical protein